MRDVNLSPFKAKVYADRPLLKEKIEPGAGLVSTRTLKFAVVPTRAGVLDLGEIRLSSFNPFTEQYEELTASIGQVNVTSPQADLGNSNDSEENKSTTNATSGQSDVDRAFMESEYAKAKAAEHRAQTELTELKAKHELLLLEHKALQLRLQAHEDEAKSSLRQAQDLRVKKKLGNRIPIQ